MTYQDLTDAELSKIYAEAELNFSTSELNAEGWYEVMEDVQAEMDERAGL